MIQDPLEYTVKGAVIKCIRSLIFTTWYWYGGIRRLPWTCGASMDMDFGQCYTCTVCSVLKCALPSIFNPKTIQASHAFNNRTKEGSFREKEGKILKLDIQAKISNWYVSLARNGQLCIRAIFLFVTSNPKTFSGRFLLLYVREENKSFSHSIRHNEFQSCFTRKERKEERKKTTAFVSLSDFMCEFELIQSFSVSKERYHYTRKTNKSRFGRLLASLAYRHLTECVMRGASLPNSFCRIDVESIQYTQRNTYKFNFWF